MTVDIIILSHAKTQALKEMTQQTINSCLASETDITFNILVLEQASGVVYEGAATHFIQDEFNYNRFMNIGIGMTSSEYVCLCNNDLLFEKQWCSIMIQNMKLYRILSASPRCPDSTYLKAKKVDFGYSNRHQVSGWCIMCNRKIFDIIGSIDDEFPFWFADNIYSEQLKKHRIKHALIGMSIVRHLGSSTLNTLDEQRHNEYTIGLIRKFIEKHPTNESAVYFRKQIGK